jgi:hypothetical protein
MSARHQNCSNMRLAILRSIAGFVFAATLAFQVDCSNAQTTPSPVDKQAGSKPLAGYTVILVEPFTVESSQATKDFPEGEEANLQLSTIVSLRASELFEKVIDGSAKPAEGAPSSEPSAKAGERKVILSGAVMSFSKGNSGARTLAWPLPVSVSKAKARFMFRDAESKQEVFRLEKEAKFQATMSGGLATKEGQMAHAKGALIEALIKEIKRNR